MYLLLLNAFGVVLQALHGLDYQSLGVLGKSNRDVIIGIINTMIRR